MELVSDLSVPDSTGSEAVVYPGSVPQDCHQISKIRSACRAKWDELKVEEYGIEVSGYTFRVRRESTQFGVSYFLRKHGRAELLDRRKVPQGIIQQLSSSNLFSGGLILVAGAAGAGKTSTATSTLKTRLHLFGGVAWTIEDPPEFAMEGKHGDRGGVCWQKAVLQGGFAQAMRNVMRCYPAEAGGVLFVGEVRDAETADQCLKAASNGLLVIATIHAGSLEGAVDRMVNLTTEVDRSIVRATLASNLRLILFQRRLPDKPGVIQFSSVWINRTSNAAMAIRDGNFLAMRNDVQYQANKMRAGQPVC